ncbi:RNA polymerase sigma factor [Sphingobacterium sp. SYP-B4668]|uniref:RNA polymerase sigma factor n=1 Tax=Sphingobacterium sp. SYP-B4668 TaxID=2996035 RepID=UPI0022DDD2D8|nr:sigma-70 family RNA polymerase sigma factor [Sphingobacterium sp. SYP-B4668]
MDVDNHHTLNALREGSEEALESIFERFKHPLLHFANAIVKDLPFSEEIVSDSFVKLWECKIQFNELNQLQAFLYTTTRNKCIDYLRSPHAKRKFVVDVTEDLLIEYPDFEVEMMRAELLDALNKEVLKLPSAQKQVVILSHFDNKTTAEIAQKLNMSNNSVYVNYARAIETLRRVFKKKKGWIY